MAYIKFSLSAFLSAVTSLDPSRWQWYIGACASDTVHSLRQTTMVCCILHDLLNPQNPIKQCRQLVQIHGTYQWAQFILTVSIPRPYFICEQWLSAVESIYSVYLWDFMSFSQLEHLWYYYLIIHPVTVCNSLLIR